MSQGERTFIVKLILRLQEDAESRGESKPSVESLLDSFVRPIKAGWGKLSRQFYHQLKKDYENGVLRGKQGQVVVEKSNSGEIERLLRVLVDGQTLYSVSLAYSFVLGNWTHESPPPCRSLVWKTMTSPPLNLKRVVFTGKKLPDDALTRLEYFRLEVAWTIHHYNIPAELVFKWTKLHLDLSLDGQGCGWKTPGRRRKSEPKGNSQPKGNPRATLYWWVVVLFIIKSFYNSDHNKHFKRRTVAGCGEF